MKIIISKIIVLAFIIALCDVAVGLVGNYLVEHAIGGDTARKCYIANKTHEDILILGSSRAIHHYDPTIIEDSLGYSVYNCGFIGNGILCGYGFYRMIAERYAPYAIICEITPDFDLLSGDNHKFLGNLRYFYERPGISRIFNDIDETEKYKMISKMYRYNSNLPQLLIENVHPLRGDNKGYRPVDKEMGEKVKPISESEHYDYDSLKIAYLEKLINDCDGKTKLIFTVSPRYSNTSSKVLEPLVDLCNKYDVPLVNSYTNESFNKVPRYFSDPSHLNRTGSTAYTKYVVSKLKEYL